MDRFWQGFVAFPTVAVVLVLILLFAARQSRAIFRWYIGMPLTRWWAMAMLVFALKHTPQSRVKVIRAQGRVWMSPMVKEFVDAEALH